MMESNVWKLKTARECGMEERTEGSGTAICLIGKNPSISQHFQTRLGGQLGHAANSEA